MKKLMLSATSGVALLVATPALAADVQETKIETVEIEMSDERRALALAAVDAYWPQGLTAYTSNYLVNDFADELLYTPIGELVERYGIIEMAAEVGAMIEEIEAMELEAAAEAGEEPAEVEIPAIDIRPEQALKGMVAMFEDQRLIDMLSAQDEHLEERIAIVREVLAEDMRTYAAAAEPEMRTHFAEMFARRFSDQELRDIAAFAATPTGQKYARQQWVMWVDPAYFRALLSSAPESLKMGMAMIEKLEARMAHLPPLFPEPEAEEGADEEVETAESLIEQAEVLEAEAAQLLEEAAALRAQASDL